MAAPHGRSGRADSRERPHGLKQASQNPTDQLRYSALQRTDPQGQVVRGLVLAHNADTHLSAALSLQVDGIVGEGNVWRVIPAWLPYDRLPAVVRSSTGSASAVHTAYRPAVGGHFVIESLLDAFAFFARCEPRLVPRDPGTGDIVMPGFLLPAYITHHYERRHPDHPNGSALEAQVRATPSALTA
jgi:hypothetical protein